jgi:hypothetical protein
VRIVARLPGKPELSREDGACFQLDDVATRRAVERCL